MLSFPCARQKLEISTCFGDDVISVEVESASEYSPSEASWVRAEAEAPGT